MTKPPAEMSADDLLSFYEFYCRYEPRHTAMQDIRSELLRRIESAPPVPKPVSEMTFDELWLESGKLYEDMDAIHDRRNLIIDELKARRKTKENAK